MLTEYIPTGGSGRFWDFQEAKLTEEILLEEVCH